MRMSLAVGRALVMQSAGTAVGDSSARLAMGEGVRDRDCAPAVVRASLACDEARCSRRECVRTALASSLTIAGASA